MSFKNVVKLIWKTRMSLGLMTRKFFRQQTDWPIIGRAYKRGYIISGSNSTILEPAKSVLDAGI